MLYMIFCARVVRLRRAFWEDTRPPWFRAMQQGAKEEGHAWTHAQPGREQRDLCFTCQQDSNHLIVSTVQYVSAHTW